MRHEVEGSSGPSVTLNRGTHRSRHRGVQVPHATTGAVRSQCGERERWSARQLPRETGTGTFRVDGGRFDRPAQSLEPQPESAERRTNAPAIAPAVYWPETLRFGTIETFPDIKAVGCHLQEKLDNERYTRL